MFTYHYSQPQEYHFSLDSIHLAEFVANSIINRDDLACLRVLDLCAGCGVIGIELSWYVRQLKQIDFVEVQDTYSSYFKQNVLTVNRPELNLGWYLLNYETLLEKEWHNKYDLIVSNPPYFQPQFGMLSPSSFKNRCRFYLDSTFKKFILAMQNSLTVGGMAYFLLRSLKQHGYDPFDEISIILKDKAISAEIIAEVRGTDVVLLKKFK